jgi:hypothetical protein
MIDIVNDIENLLDNFSGFEKKSDNQSITVYPNDKNGFLVSLIVEPGEYIVQWGPCHHHFDNNFDYDTMQRGVDLFWAGLSDITRLLAYSKGNKEYNWIFQIKEDSEWKTVDNTMVILNQFWLKKTEKIYQNKIIESYLLNDLKINVR